MIFAFHCGKYKRVTFTVSTQKPSIFHSSPRNNPIANKVGGERGREDLLYSIFLNCKVPVSRQRKKRKDIRRSEFMRLIKQISPTENTQTFYKYKNGAGHQWPQVEQAALRPGHVP